MAGALEIARRALDELGFFSKALEEAKGAKMKSGTVQQWKNTLQKQGVKPAELDATGFSALPPDKPLSKDDLVDYLTQNRVQLSEKKLTKGDAEAARVAREAALLERGRTYNDYERFVEQNRDRLGSPADAPNETMQEALRLYQLHEAAAERAREATRAAFQANDTLPKYEQWSLPGGQNYQETLLTLPKPAPPQFEVVLPDGQRTMPFPTRQEAFQWTQNSANGGRSGTIEMVRPSSNGGPLTFGPHNNPHWDDPNVAVHYRTKERLGPNGERVLHIDEVQSDWGQQGAREGFFDPKLEQARKKAEAAHTQAGNAYMQAVRDHQSYVNANHPYLDPENKLDIWELQPLELARQERMAADPGWRESVARIEEARRRFEQARRAVPDAQEGTVPMAPFVTDEKAWTDLALKRAMIEAERGGYDALAFTRGAEQAERYNLANRVGRIYYSPETRRLEVNGPEDTLLHEGNYAPEKLAEVIGRENAERLLQAPTTGAGYHRLEPDDMVWGGKGMTRYYDQALPSRIDKLARSLDPEARLETMPAGRRLELTNVKDQDGYHTGAVRVLDPDGGLSRDFESLHEAGQFRMEHGWPQDTQPPTLNMLRLTPRMKEQIRQGLPLFVGAPAVVGGALSQAQQWQAPEANEFARGGRVRAFESGGYADRGYEAPDAGMPGASTDALGAALGDTSYGSWDTTSRGFAGQDSPATNTGYLGNAENWGEGSYGFGLGGELGRTGYADFGPTMQGWETDPSLQGWQHEAGFPGDFTRDLPTPPADPVNAALGRGWSPVGGGWDTTEQGVRGLTLRESIFPEPGQTRVGQREARTGEWEDVQGLVGKLAPMDFSLPPAAAPTFSPGYVDAFPGRLSTNVIDVRNPAAMGQRPSEVDFTHTSWNTPQATARGATAPGLNFAGRPVPRDIENYVGNVLNGVEPGLAEFASRLGLARGGSVESEARERTDNSYADEMDLRDRYAMPGWDRAAATKIPLGDMAPPRLPSVIRHFEDGGYTGLDDPRFDKTTRDMPARHVDVPALVKSGALRITYEADGKGGYIKNDDPESFTVVTRVNDMAPDSPTKGWPDKPISVMAANRIINGRQRDGKVWLDDGKRAQIEASAEMVRRKPKVQKFDLGGLAGPDPDTPSSTFDANQSYADWSADYYGGGLGAALGNTSFGGWDTTSQGWTGGGGYVGNTGGLGLGAYTGNVGSALGNTSGGSFGLGYGEGTVGGSDLGMGSGWGGAGEGNLGQPEPGYSGSAGAIMEGAGLGNVFGGSTEPNYLSQNIGMLGANLLDPTPIAEQSVDRANAIATTADFTPALDPSVALATALPTDMPAPNFGRAAREQEFPAEDPVDFTGPMAGRVPELGVLPDNMPTRAEAREQFAREYMRDRLTEQYGRPPSEHFLDSMLGRFKVEAPNLLSGKTPDEVNSIGATGLMQTLGARKDALLDFRAAQDPNVGNLRRDLDYAVQTMSPSTVQIGTDFNNRRDFSRFSDAVVNARNLEEGMRAMNAYERAGGWNGYGTPIGSVDGGKRSMDYAREFQREYNPTAAAGTGRRADAGGILSELFGIGSAQAAERVPGAVAQADIPEIDIWQGEKNILQGIARGLRSITGTTEDGTQPMPDAPVGPDYGFSRSIPTDTMGPGSRGNALAGGLYNSAQRMGLNTPAQPDPELASWERGLGSPVPGLPAPMEVASVPMPPERPTDLPSSIPAPTDDPEQSAPSRPSMVAAAMPDEAMPSTNRFNIDPLTGNLYDPETGNRVIDPRYVSRASDLVIGLTPFGPINSLLALAGGVTGYPLSGGQLMALGRPGAPGGYSVNEGNVYAGRPSEVAAGLRTTSGGGGGALSTVAATTQGRVPDYIAREFLGVDESPETYGMRGQRSYYSYG